MSHGLCMTGAEGTVIVLNRRMRKFFKIEHDFEEMSVRRLAEWIAAAGAMLPEARAAFISTFEQHLAKDTPSVFSETIDGRVYDFRCQPRAQTGQGGPPAVVPLPSGLDE